MKIAVGISSGIAAYKIVDLVKSLVADNHVVTVVLSQSATHLVSAEELQHITKQPVYTSLFPADFSTEKILKERKVDHIEIAQGVDLIVIAPATANTMAKLAHGIADDFLTTMVLAATAPILICPSMNTTMWNHPATQKNMQSLQQFGYEIMLPASGSLACGTEGVGRLPEIQTIKKEIDRILAETHSLQGKKIIVTAGGTSEAIDDARSISNRSSGKMGVAIAEECYRRGAEVLLISTITSLKTFLPIRQEQVTTAADLYNKTKQFSPDYNYIFHTAAVSDFTVEPRAGKIDSDKAISLHLIPTKKIIKEVKHWNPAIRLIGFKAVHGNDLKIMEQEATLQLHHASVDFVVVNDISRHDIGFSADENEVVVFGKKGTQTKIEKMSKRDIAKKLISLIMRSPIVVGDDNTL